MGSGCGGSGLRCERQVPQTSRSPDDLAVLDSYVPASREDLLRDRVGLGHLKYTFVALLEGCLDAAHHVGAAQGYGPADTTPRRCVCWRVTAYFPTSWPCAWRRPSASATVLVHGYAVVDNPRVVAYLDQLDDVRLFVRLLTELITD